jgi:pimeloyl-ACP methyl ester carboxylesterase
MPIQSLRTGIDLYYEVHGEGDPVVLVPATGFSCDVWKEPYQLPALAENHKVIIFDQRGTGRSTHYAGVYTIEQMAQDVIALLEFLEVGPAHLVGHSMGGRIGLSIALDSPGSLKSLVLAATGSGAAGRGGGRAAVPGFPYEVLEALVERGFDEFLRHDICDTDLYFSDGYRAAHPDKVQEFFDRVLGTIAPRPQYVRHVIARHTFEATHRLVDITVPTLVVVGTGDTTEHDHVKQSAALRDIPGSEFLLLEGQSHAFFWEKSEETNAWLLEWFAKHS